MPDVYYFSWFLALGTLAISFVLKNSVTSRFGFGWLRKIVSDFAVITGTNKKLFVGSYRSDVKTQVFTDSLRQLASVRLK